MKRSRTPRFFLEFPWTLYQGDPYWVPPLVSMQRRKLNKDKNPYNITLKEWTDSDKLQQTLRVTRKNSERCGITVRAIDPRF